MPEEASALPSASTLGKRVMIAHKTPLSILEEEERRARFRLASYRAKLYNRGAASGMAAETRLRELERQVEARG